MFDVADFELVWPRELFVREARTLLALFGQSSWSGSVEWFLVEAFAGDQAADFFRTGTWDLGHDDPFGPLPIPGERGILQGLIAWAGELRHADERAPYWSQRRSANAQSPLSIDATWTRFVELVEGFNAQGYLARTFPEPCVDDDSSAPFVDRSLFLEERLGVAGLWPLGRKPGWTEDVFFDLVEVFHDIVARPRRRWWHDYSSCGWHYSDFALDPARFLYRWRVNRLLERSTLPYRLAVDGEDVGRLVAVSDDAREDLRQRMVARQDEHTGDRLRHAVAQFRARGSGEHDKRAAAITLAGILEERRGLLQKYLFRKDEDALFEIANRFAIRHQNQLQQADYDPVFLDWIFWWYLATIELTDRVLAGHVQAGS